jgi:tetratricopeptide (TPR) repeat protein
MRLTAKTILAVCAASAVCVLATADSGGGTGLRSIRSQYNRKEYDRAEAALREELPGMRGRTRDQGRLLLADLQTDSGRAADLLESVMETGDSRESLKARVELAKIRYSTGEYYETVRILDGVRAEGRGDEKYEAVYFRGLARKQLGDLEGARRDFEDIDRGDYLYWSYIAIAELDMRSGRIGEAVRRYETIAADHSSPIAGFRLGECYELSGDIEKAMQTYRNVARNFPRSPEAPKAREKMQMIDSAIKRTAEASTAGGGEEGEAPAEESGAGADGSQKYTLQFGAFSEKRNAESFISDLEALIDGLHIEVAESGGNLWYRVRAGRYSSREEAEEAALRVMRRTGYSSKVLPLE